MNIIKRLEILLPMTKRQPTITIEVDKEDFPMIRDYFTDAVEELIEGTMVVDARDPADEHKKFINSGTFTIHTYTMKLILKEK